ncbi:MAG: PAS domain-containing protein [Gammaproteobacteria bacterium]|nr:PAS domain-containing protein [Rhodoferax sp.]MBU3898024.1 PAS domain-containing protein [Gammaproteobacteria bacterium]MBU3999219.1 PAS domain-containing protein [Gammaproteobacteria bacterium]MBU4081782.1 PAS domain-containing protein [Gammaproteobacteria bacterium]MBU4112882.1 PAS domain-containing protein [Gammaproteobacteria bacterium]
MTARATLGAVLLSLQGTILLLGTAQDSTLLLICSGYFVAAMGVRLLAHPRQLGRTFDLQWLSTIGVDMLAFSALQLVQGSSINYAPLFALPILMASILGSLLVAMGTAAGVTLLLFAYATWMSIQGPGDITAHFLQAALTGAGCFVISFLASQIASRLVNVELRAQRSQLAAQVQRRVNELVIESLTEGILVVDQRGIVRAANPAAWSMLGFAGTPGANAFNLNAMIEWQGLVDLMKNSFAGNSLGPADVTIHPTGQGPRRIQVRTQLTAAQAGDDERLCVMFLQDQREMQARMRTEKLASMGRLSTAVAHEIRNPLAAIAQANALLDEDLVDPRHKQLTRMVQQNAKRLDKIVEDILDVSRVQRLESGQAAAALDLNESVERICRDWQSQTASEHQLSVQLPPGLIEVTFEPEHLRRILVNLLDNARRYASHQLNAIQVLIKPMTLEHCALSVWSDGQPMDQSVERHLFEPFFSSESRSSGLGLYICRELCEGHGAAIGYSRVRRNMAGKQVDGNEFLVTLRTHTAMDCSQSAGQHT